MAGQYIINNTKKLFDDNKYLTAFNLFPYNGLRFDGIANYCRVVYGNFGTDFTLLLYVKNLTLTAQGTVFRISDGSGNTGFYFEFTGNNIIFYYFPAPLYQFTVPVNTLNLNFFGLSVSDTTYTLNINGVTTTYPKAQVVLNMNTFEVGGRGFGLNSNSIIYDCKILNTPLSSAQLNDFYNRGALPSSLLPNRIGDWAFEERSGNIAYDSSANNLHLALLNFTAPQVNLGANNNHVDHTGASIV